MKKANVNIESQAQIISRILCNIDRLSPQNYAKAIKILDDLVARQEQAEK